MEAISLCSGRSPLVSVIPIQTIGSRSIIVGIVLRRRIGIRRHRMKRHVCDSKRSGFVEVHVLHESIRVEEIIPRPSGGKRRQRRRAELSVNVLARAEDNELIVNMLQQGSDIAVACIAPAKLRERSGGAGLIVVIGEIAGNLAFYLPGIATEAPASRTPAAARSSGCDWAAPVRCQPVPGPNRSAGSS